MLFYKLFQRFCLLFLLFHTSRRDAKQYRIPAGDCWMLVLLSAPCLLPQPIRWLERLGISLILCLCLMGLLLLLARFIPRIRLGGGDIKFLFALLLHLDRGQILLFLGLVCVYILLIHGTWPDKRKLPLGPALAGAAACMLLSQGLA